MEKCEKGAQTIENLFQITYSQITPDHDYKILFNDQLSLNSQVMSDELMAESQSLAYMLTKGTNWVISEEDIKEAMGDPSKGSLPMITCQENRGEKHWNLRDSRTILLYKFVKDIFNIHLKLTRGDFVSLKEEHRINPRVALFYMRYYEKELHINPGDIYIFPQGVTEKLCGHRLRDEFHFKELYNSIKSRFPIEMLIRKRFIIFPCCLDSIYFLIIVCNLPVLISRIKLYPIFEREINYEQLPCVLVFDVEKRSLQYLSLNIRKMLDMGIKDYYSNQCDPEFISSLKKCDGLTCKTMPDYYPQYLSNTNLLVSKLDSCLIMIEMFERFLNDHDEIINSQIFGFVRMNEKWLCPEHLRDKKRKISQIISNLLRKNDPGFEYLIKPIYLPTLLPEIIKPKSDATVAHEEFGNLTSEK